MNHPADHPDFTAMALGEHIQGTPAQHILEALRSSVSARREADAIHDTGRLLGAALRDEPELRLDAARRHAIFRADPEAVRARFAAEEADAAAARPFSAPRAAAAPRRTWLVPTAAAAAVAIAGYWFLTHTRGPGRSGTRPAVAAEEDANPEPTGSVRAMLPKGRDGTTNRDLAPARELPPRRPVREVPQIVVQPPAAAPKAPQVSPPTVPPPALVDAPPTPAPKAGPMPEIPLQPAPAADQRVYGSPEPVKKKDRRRP